MTDRKEGTLYLANGLALTGLFFAARVVCYGAGLWHLWGLRRDLFPRPQLAHVMPRCHMMHVASWMQGCMGGAIRATTEPSAFCPVLPG